MNPLQLRLMKISSFSSISIVFTTGALLREYPYILRPLRPMKVSTNGKANPATLCFIPIAGYPERSRYNSGGRWP